jgi:hypothetical protein
VVLWSVLLAAEQRCVSCEVEAQFLYVMRSFIVYIHCENLKTCVIVLLLRACVLTNLLYGAEY